MPTATVILSCTASRLVRELPERPTVDLTEDAMARLPKFMLTHRDAALRLGGVTAVVAFPLPVGFHSLPRDEQKRLLHEQLSRVAEVAEDAIDNNLDPAA